MNLQVFLSIATAAFVDLSFALRIPIEKSTLNRRSGEPLVSISQLKNLQVASPSQNSTLTLSDVRDVIYFGNITLGGQDFVVQLDTGSSDTWVTGFSSSFVSSSLPLQNFTYGIGWAYGEILYAAAQFAGISIHQQAFLNASNAENPALSYGASGIAGLGFDTLSNIEVVVTKAGASTGHTLLYNLFHDNPSEPNFIAFSFQSSVDGNGVVGSLAVGETDPQYSNVTQTNKIPTWPVSSPSRWNVLLDSFVVGTQTYYVETTVPGAPLNKAVVLLDTGTSYTYVSEDVCNTLYGGIPGAQFDTGLGQWIIPCDVEIDIALQIDNQIFPIHPLDVTPSSVGDPNTCLGSFLPQPATVGKGQFDWLIGDNVLRSVYTLYDFGDFDSSGKMGDPYVQMLPLVDPNLASIEFHTVRGGTPLSNITYNVSNSSSGVTVTDVTDTIEQLSRYLPAMLVVMALNAALLIFLTIVGGILLCKRRRKGIRTRRTPGRLTPAPRDSTPLDTFSDIRDSVPNTYQPVSVALTEDTLFMPPSPAFKAQSRYGDRPNSIA